jgi:hypothetical protein
MLVEIMEIKVLVNLLLSVEWCCEPRDGGKFIGGFKGTFAFFEVLSACPVNVHWMPMDLTAPVVRMPMEGRNHTT